MSFSIKDYFHQVVAHGKKYSKVVRKNEKSLEGRVLKKDVVEIYLPIMNGLRFLGAFEIYYDITERKNKLDALANTVRKVLDNES